MENALALATANLLSPMVLFFALGLGAALARSDLAVPEAVAKTLAIYLMLAIGFKGGASLAGHGFDLRVVGTLAVGALLSFAIPLLGYVLLRATSRLSQIDAAAVAAHYGSISIVTFVAATQSLASLGIDYEGYVVAVAAVMEMPAILSGLWLARRGSVSLDDATDGAELWREVALNGSIVMLIGAFAIGWITGEDGMAMISPFIVDPFQGVLCLFLLDMGLIAGRGLIQAGRSLRLPVIAFGLYMPLISAGLAAALGAPLGLSAGGLALLVTLAASASYIAVPAAMRLALPEARPAIYLTLSLGVTFPFNLTVGIPLYAALADWIT